MTRKIIFTDHAIDTLLSATSFVQQQWGLKQAEKFLNKVYKTVNLTADNPYMFKAFKLSDDTRIGLISKQTSFIYRVQENEIIILFFWDNRQDRIFES